MNAIDFHGRGSRVDGSLWHHTTAVKAREELKYWDEYFKYTTVRNPWDRYLSLFSYLRDKARGYQAGTDKLSPAEIHQGKHAAHLFEVRSDAEVLRKLIINNLSQDKYFTDSNKSVILDYIAKLEDVNNEFNLLCNRVGISSPVKLNHSNKSENQDGIDELYTQELIDMVSEKESVVISLKNYTFAGRKIK